VSAQELYDVTVLAEIGLEADKDYRGLWAEVEDFWIPLSRSPI